MGNCDGIVSGFFTAVLHALLALLTLFFASGGEGPFTHGIVFASIVMLVCCLGLVVRSHFSSIALLALDLVLIGLAITWCIVAIIAFQAPPPLDSNSWDVTQKWEQVSEVATLVAAVVALLMSTWLASRVYRLEKRLRRGRRPAQQSQSSTP